MSIDKAIYNAIKEALTDHLSQRPAMLKKNNMAKMLDVSVDQIDKLIKSRVLIEEVHFTRFTAGGVPMFFVSEVVATLKPRLAKEKI